MITVHHNGEERYVKKKIRTAYERNVIDVAVKWLMTYCRTRRGQSLQNNICIFYDVKCIKIKIKTSS